MDYSLTTNSQQSSWISQTSHQIFFSLFKITYSFNPQMLKLSYLNQRAGMGTCASRDLGWAPAHIGKPWSCGWCLSVGQPPQRDSPVPGWNSALFPEPVPSPQASASGHRLAPDTHETPEQGRRGGHMISKTLNKLTPKLLSGCRTLPGSKSAVWCTHGNLPCVLIRALCLAAGWWWWPLWGRATPESPVSSVGRPALRLCDGTRGSDHCRGKDKFLFRFVWFLYPEPIADQHQLAIKSMYSPISKKYMICK